MDKAIDYLDDLSVKLAQLSGLCNVLCCVGESNIAPTWESVGDSFPCNSGCDRRKSGGNGGDSKRMVCVTSQETGQKPMRTKENIMLAKDNALREFSVEKTLEIGVDEAIFIDYLTKELQTAYSLYSSGKENEIELVIADETPWIPKTLNELCADLPFWSVKQVRRIVDSCKKQNLILTGNYNQDPRDRRLWYAMSGMQ